MFRHLLLFRYGALLLVAVLLNAANPQDLLHAFSGHHDAAGCNPGHTVISEYHQHCKSLQQQLQAQQTPAKGAISKPSLSYLPLMAAVIACAPDSPLVSPTSRGPPALG